MSTSRASEPPVSVVVPTLDRRERLVRLLGALAAQRDAPGFEVVVVDDGSTDGSADAARSLAGELPYPLSVLSAGAAGPDGAGGDGGGRPVERTFEAPAGPARARNRGWRAARGPVVAFVDDDCVPDTAWLAELGRALEGADLALGRTTFPAAQAHLRGPFGSWMEVEGEDEGHYPTCNIAYRRAVLEAVGGFDEDGFRYRRAGPGGRRRAINGEDTDLAWRAKEAGFRSTFVPGALVHHDVHPSDFRTYLRDVRRYEGLVLLLRKHPALRRRLAPRGFYRPIHAAALVALAGLVTLAARPRSPAARAGAGAGAAWYAWQCRRGHHSPGPRWRWATVVPRSFVAQLYAVAVMGRASVRHRVLVL